VRKGMTQCASLKTGGRGRGGERERDVEKNVYSTVAQPCGTR